MEGVFLFFKQGFWMLWFVISAMAIVAIWRLPEQTQKYRIIWTAIIVLLPIIGVGIWLGFGWRQK